MIGAFLGDMIGAPYEFDMGGKTKDFPLFCEYSQFTDDTVMTAAVAEALLSTMKQPDSIVKTALVMSMRKWGKQYPGAGYGVRFIDWLDSSEPQPYRSYGNGSAMRVSAAGWLYDTLDETRHIARLTAEVTHNHPEGIKGAEATASAIFLARTAHSKEEIKDYIVREFNYDLSRTCDEIRPYYHHVESCQETVPEAITAFLEGTDFEDVIRTAVSLGGDCDTLTCIAGSIAEAYYGVPDKLKEECLSRLPEDIKEVLSSFRACMKKRRPAFDVDSTTSSCDEHPPKKAVPLSREQRKERLIRVFDDTKVFYSANPVLIAGIADSRQKTRLYDADDYPSLDGCDPGKMQSIRVTRNKSFQAAMDLRREFPEKRIAVLNFASASNPGGGVETGSSAQEESLCRCSTLYPTLNQSWLWDAYYNVNRAAHDVRHTDACIYSPNVIICKTDNDIPERMREKDFVTVDVVSCAAPNLRHEPANYHNPETGEAIRMDPDGLYALHCSRAKHILHVAAFNRADILVLGAFGCGAFENDPNIVAKAYRAALDDYLKFFDVVEFAIFCMDYEIENYIAFRSRLCKE